MGKSSSRVNSRGVEGKMLAVPLVHVNLRRIEIGWLHEMRQQKQEQLFVWLRPALNGKRA